MDKIVLEIRRASGLKDGPERTCSGSASNLRIRSQLHSLVPLRDTFDGTDNCMEFPVIENPRVDFVTVEEAAVSALENFASICRDPHKCASDAVAQNNTKGIKKLLTIAEKIYKECPSGISVSLRKGGARVLEIDLSINRAAIVSALTFLKNKRKVCDTEISNVTVSYVTADGIAVCEDVVNGSRLLLIRDPETIRYIEANLGHSMNLTVDMYRDSVRLSLPIIMVAKVEAAQGGGSGAVAQRIGNLAA